MGASIIEKHFIDKSSRKGPDISASVNSDQMRDLLHGVKLIYQAKPGGIKPVKEENSRICFCFS